MNIEDVKTVDDWRTATGTRFRLLKDEKERGLSREQALAERITAICAYGDDAVPEAAKACPQKKTTRKASRSKKGDILIRIRPRADVDPDYFEHLTGKQIEVVMDEKWYSWLDNKLDVPYDGDISKLMKHMLDLGIGEMVSRISFEDDVKDHERIFGN